MNDILQVLILEDSESDALLIERQLDREEVVFDHRWVVTPEDFETALDEHAWDVILCDYVLGQFTGLDALEIVKRKQLDIPFIIVSGTVGEELAVAAMRAGAHDYIMKDRLERLAPALIREVKDAGIRRDAQAMRENLAASNLRWQTTFDALDNPILILSADRRIEYCNIATLAFLDRDRDEVIGHHCWEVMHETDGPIEGCPFDSSRDNSSRATVKLTVGDKIFDVATDPIFSAEDGVTFSGAVHILTDITDLVRSEERFHQFFENEPSYCYMISPESTIIDVNRSALSALGYDREELIGQPISMIYDPESQSIVKEIFEDWKKTGRLIDHEMKLLTKEGEVRTVLLNASAIRDAQGEIIHSISVQTDITARREAEEQLSQSLKMESIGRLAGGIAHDFNNLMTVVTGYSEIMREKIKKGVPIIDELDQVALAGTRATDLTQQLLAFSRRQVFKLDVLDMNEIIASFEKMLLRIIGEDIDLIFMPQSSLEMVKLDRGQIEQVIMNLVVNARDAMPEGGKLTLETMNVDLDEGYSRSHIGVEPGPYVMFAVTDSGIGMDDVAKDRMFEPFFTTKETGKGTGLGLSTVYGIVKQSNGYINVYSEPGQGTTFKLYFPVTVEAEQSVARPDGDVRRPSRGNETLLVVEDDDAVREAVSAMLESSGYNVLSVREGEEALRICAELPEEIDLLLTDVVMPGMNGPELATRIAEFSPGVLVVFMSGYTGNAIHHQGILDLDTAYIQKPFTPVILTRLIRDVLDGVER